MSKTLSRGVPGLAVPLLAAGALLFSMGVARAQTGATVQSGDTAALGEVLTGPDGKTLYLFSNDTPGVSNCAGNCLTNWPPLTVAAGATPTAADGLALTLGTIVRSDTGATQVTLDGLPLYYWAFDQAPGDTMGHGVASRWAAIDTDGEALAMPAASPTAATSPTTPAPGAPAAGTGTADGAGSPATSLFLALGLGVAGAGALTLAAGRRRKGSAAHATPPATGAS